jgi:eukaryotic-like serine/threonine-protein kinase
MASPADLCPSPDALESIAIGAPPGPGIREHLAACPACQQALRRIRDDNRFLRSFASGGGLTTRAPTISAAAVNIPGYEIIREIHRGGQGVVYQAVQRSTARHVAIKVMKQGPFATLSDRGRFEREIETLAKLDHPNIVAVHDAGVVAGLHYFVMNYVDGRPLDEALPTAGVATAADVASGPVAGQSGLSAHGERSASQARVALILNTFIKVCDAVHAAHLRGVIHRDLKPSNIRVDPQGEPHVLDFGLAKSVDADGESAMTRTGQFVGSLPWASPEQVEGASARIDLRTDVYSLGAILYQLLTGTLPFDVGSNLRDAVHNILFREPLPPSTLVDTPGGQPLDNELDTIVLKCLAKDRERRYHTAGELARELRRYLAGEAIEAKRDSALYMLRKTLGRYWLQAAVVSTFVALVSVFGIVMTVLYRRAAHLEHAAIQSATSLNDLLSQSNIEQGRMAGMLGNMEQAEQLLWRELLTHRDVGSPSAIHLNNPPGSPAAYWSLWEMYRRYPCRRTLPSPSHVLRTATLSTDGQSLWTVDVDGLVQRLDPAGQPTESYRVRFAGWRGIPLTDATGTLIYHSDAQHHAIWRRAAGEWPVFELPTGVESVCLARSGGRIAAVIDGAAVVWDTDPVAEVARLRSAAGNLCVLALSNDGQRLASRDRLGNLQVWNIASQQCIARAPSVLPPREALHYAGELLFAPDDRWLADAWMDTPGRIWDLSTDPPTGVEFSERPGDYRVQAFTPDGQLLAVGDLGGAVRTFDTRTGQRRSSFVAHHGRVRCITFTGDGRNLWTGGETDLRLWDVDAQAGVQIVRVEGEVFHTVTISPDGSALYAAGGLGTLHRIARDSLRVTTDDFGNQGTVSCVALSPDGRYTAAATYANVAYIWDSQEPNRPATRLPHPNFVSHLCFSPDSQHIATSCDDFVIRIWRAEDGGLERVLGNAGDRAPQVAFDPTGRRLAVAVRSGALLVWDLDTDACETWGPPNQKPLRAVSFTPDGRSLVAAGAERTVTIWDTALRQRAATLVGHNQEIFCLDISPSGELIATGDTGGAIRLWHALLRQPLATLEGHTGPVMSLRFAPDGRTLLSASLDGTVRVWDLTYYAQHIAGNIDVQLAHLDAEHVDTPKAAAWRSWATELVSP